MDDRYSRKQLHDGNKRFQASAYNHDGTIAVILRAIEVEQLMEVTGPPDRR